MTAEGANRSTAIKPLPDRVILGVVCVTPRRSSLFGFVVDGPERVAARPRRDRHDARRAADRLFRGRRHRRGLRERRPADALRMPRLSTARGAKMTGAAVACLFLVLGFGLFGKNLLNIWSIVARRLPLCALQGGAVLGPHQHGILRRGARPGVLGNPVQHDAGARGPGTARGRHEPRHRLRPGPGRRAALQGAHGLQPVQHGLHRRHRRHAGRRHVQVLRLRAGPGDDLDDGQQPPARRGSWRSCSRR